MRAALLVCTALLAGAAHAEKVEGGEHRRIDAGKRGPIHIFTPPHYRAASAGVVVYVHGFFSGADDAWTKHKLARQFRASRVNALFIVPEAPVGPDDEIAWPRLGELLREVGKELELPTGPLVAMGHSAAYKTIAGWLDYGPLDTVILLDALYGQEEDYHAWLTSVPGHASHRLLIVASDAVRYADPLIERLGEARTLKRVPRRWDDLPSSVRRARVVYLRPPLGHMEMVTQGATIPVVLGFAPITRSRR